MLGYGKLEQVEWLVNVICHSYKVGIESREVLRNGWDDDLLVRTILFHVSIHALEDSKLDIKVWSLACSVMRFEWNFKIDCGNVKVEEAAMIARKSWLWHKTWF